MPRPPVDRRRRWRDAHGGHGRGSGCELQPDLAAYPGFLLTRGRYIPFEAPDPRVQIFPTGINNRGQIVGEYIIASRKESIMLRDPRGRITSFDVPGARGTEANDINDRGQIVGTYSGDTPIVNNSARPRAYLLIALVAASSRGSISPELG